MPRRLITGVLFLAAALTARDDAWIRMASPNFEMYSSAGERPTREALAYFEQVRGFFLQALGRDTTPERVFIVAFGSKKQYEPYRLNEFATAYYHSSGDRDYIVLSEAGADVFPVAIHEYVHLVTRHLDLKLPTWINEGLAEFYSTLKPQGDNIIVGSLIAGRYQALLRENWVPLATIVSVDQKSPYYNEKGKAGAFYNESWALTHMLLLHEAYRPKVNELILALHDGVASADALTRIYGKPIAAIDRDLQQYLQGALFRGLVLPIKLSKAHKDMDAGKAEPFAVSLILAELVNRPGNHEEARRLFEGLAATHPKRPEPFTELGYLEWRQGDNDQARRLFAKAFELGDRNPRMLWDYGRMSAGRPAEACSILRTLLKQQPDRNDVRLFLAKLLVVDHQAESALAAIAPIKKVSSEDAPELFRIMAYAQAAAGNRGEARSSAQRWQQQARDAREKAAAAAFLKSLEHTQAGLPLDDDRLPDRPRLVRRADAPAPPRDAEPPPPPAIEGRFIQLDCLAGQAKMLLQDGNGTKTFLIDDPGKLRVTAAGGGSLEFVCGPQKPPLNVRMEYDLAPAGTVDGIVRAIEVR